MQPRLHPHNGKWEDTSKILEGKYSLESTDPCKSEIRTHRQLTIVIKLSYYLFIIAKLFKVKDGCLKFVYNIKTVSYTHLTLPTTPYV